MVNNLMYNSLLQPSYAINILNPTNASVLLAIEATVSILSPLAGYVADMKYSQYEVLKVSTQFMIAFEFFILVVWILLSSIVNTTDYKLYLLVSSMLISVISYWVGRVFFITKIIQFGIEQLRDEPTIKSDNYLIMVLFVEKLTELVIKTCKSSFNFKWLLRGNFVSIDNKTIIFLHVCFSISVLCSVIILFVVERL